MTVKEETLRRVRKRKNEVQALAANQLSQGPLLWIGDTGINLSKSIAMCRYSNC